VQFSEEVNDYFSKMPITSAQEHASVADLIVSSAIMEDDKLSKYAAQGSQLLTANARNSLAEDLAKFISLRAGADAETYASYMRDRGAALKPLEEFDALPPFKQRMFTIHAGRERLPDDTPWTMFRDAFEGELAHGRGGATRPAGIVRDERASKVLFSIVDTQKDGAIYYAFDELASEIFQNSDMSDSLTAPSKWGDSLWYIGQGYDGWTHWRPPIALPEIVTRDGAALVCEVHLVTSAISGNILPTRIFAYYDPAANHWHIEGMMYINTYGIAIGTGPEY